MNNFSVKSSFPHTGSCFMHIVSVKHICNWNFNWSVNLKVKLMLN